MAVIRPDAGDDDHDQAEYDQGEDEKKPDDKKTQKNGNDGVDHQRDLKVKGFLGLFDHKFRIMLLYLPDNDGRDDIAQGDKHRRKGTDVGKHGPLALFFFADGLAPMDSLIILAFDQNHQRHHRAGDKT
jgi:hypothetical protein